MDALLRLFNRFGKRYASPTVSVSSLTSWHADTVDAVFTMLSTNTEGLSKTEAANRLARHGPNQLAKAKTRSSLLRFFCQFHNVLIYVLMAASAVTALLAHWLDAGVILGVVILNAVIGFVQEGKSEDALQAIRQMP